MVSDTSLCLQTKHLLQSYGVEILETILQCSENRSEWHEKLIIIASEKEIIALSNVLSTTMRLRRQSI